MYLSQPSRRLVWLQIPALFFLWSAISNSAFSRLEIAIFGTVFGLSYVVPLLLQLKLVPQVAVVLGVIQTGEWALVSLGAHQFLSGHPVLGALATACLLTTVVWLDYTLIPLWGTTQSWARPWVAFPQLIQFVAFTGHTGVVWVLGVTTALLSIAVRFPSARLASIVDIALIVALFGLVNFWLWQHTSKQSLRVAVIGWAGNQFDGLEWKQLAFEDMLMQAIRSGAQFIVTPEAAFAISNRDDWRRAVRAVAAQHKVALAIGYFDTQRNENCIDFVSPIGEIEGRYVKTHLVPVFEHYQAGKGLRTGLNLENVQIGGVICQDDNFTDIARGYGRDRAQLLAIPTNDWRAVKDFHALSCQWRALENRYAIARAADNGISTFVSPRGELLSASDHFQTGAQVLLQDLPVGKGQITLFARLGEWFPLLCGLLVLVWLVVLQLG